MSIRKKLTKYKPCFDPRETLTQHNIGKQVQLQPMSCVNIIVHRNTPIKCTNKYNTVFDNIYTIKYAHINSRVVGNI